MSSAYLEGLASEGAVEELAAVSGIPTLFDTEITIAGRLQSKLHGSRFMHLPL
jgi:hypothetical protein